MDPYVAASRSLLKEQINFNHEYRSKLKPKEELPFRIQSWIPIPIPVPGYVLQPVPGYLFYTIVCTPMVALYLLF